MHFHTHTHTRARARARTHAQTHTPHTYIHHKHTHKHHTHTHRHTHWSFVFLGLSKIFLGNIHQPLSNTCWLCFLWGRNTKIQLSQFLKDYGSEGCRKYKPYSKASNLLHTPELFLQNQFQDYGLASQERLYLGGAYTAPFCRNTMRQKTLQNLLMALRENTQAAPSVFQGLKSSDIIESYHMATALFHWMALRDVFLQTRSDTAQRELSARFCTSPPGVPVRFFFFNFTPFQRLVIKFSARFQWLCIRNWKGEGPLSMGICRTQAGLTSFVVKKRIRSQLRFKLCQLEANRSVQNATRIFHRLKIKVRPEMNIIWS